MIQMDSKPRKIGLSAAQTLPADMGPFELIGRTEHVPQGAPHPPSRQPSSAERQSASRRVRGPGRRPPARPNKQISSGCREVRDAASASRLAIAYSGCQPPCYPRHGTKEHPPCAQTPHGVPWLVFLPRRKTTAPSSCAQEPLRVLLSHEGVRQGVGVSKKVQHAHSPGPGGPVPP